MAIPDTETFDFRIDVRSETDLAAATSLSGAFALATTNHFNRLYYPKYLVAGVHANEEDSLLNFRDYNHVLRPPESFSVYRRRITDLLWTWLDNAWDETGYYIERSDDGVSGWVEVKTTAADVEAYLDQGLTPDTTYYYRIRTFNGTGNSTWIEGHAATQPLDASGWFLPSQVELGHMYGELKAYGYGSFSSDYYWCSTNHNTNNARRINFSDGVTAYALKSNYYCVRASKSFIGVENDYALRDTGPNGGLIYWILDHDDGSGDFGYWEAAASDASDNHIWSNVAGTPTTYIDLGLGYYNCTQIIAESGHTNSAARLCLDL